ncbi:phosphoethanolamine transferase [Enterovibrio sp. 27052020O]|uniref:phosphoethanolamine transferase n=1 Tax=Enterovibrio sp. 27052020O TaxID=3241166 RepID=UPI00388D68BE
MRFISLPIKTYWMATFVVALYFSLVLNLPIYQNLYQIFHDLEHVKIGFIISIPIFFTLALNFIFNIFSWPYFFKPIFIALVIVSSMVSYGSFNYGIIFDRDMLINILQTNTSESTSYLSAHSVAWVVLFGVVPAIFIALFPLDSNDGAVRILLGKLASMLFSVVGILLIASLYYKDYSSVGRNNSYLKKVIIPTHVVYSGYKVVKEEYFSEPREYKSIGLDARQVPDSESDGKKPVLMVFVVGETARSANFQYQGYDKPTNAFTEKYSPIYFSDVTSCGTATALSVPCMFSMLDRGSYNSAAGENQDNVIDVLQRAGISMNWEDNDGGDKGVAKHIPKTELHGTDAKDACNGSTCFDAALLDGLNVHIDALTGNRIVFLHLIGSHGPTYYQRYPASMAYFQPDCQRSDIENCTSEQIVNTYDNTIRYTDFVLSELIEKLKLRSDEFATAMVYLSDHGESLGEGGVFLHGLPYSFAPETQKKIPLLFWGSDDFMNQKQIDEACLRNKASQPFSHDNVSHTLLGIMDVSTEAYSQPLDIFAGCRYGAGH